MVSAQPADALLGGAGITLVARELVISALREFAAHRGVTIPVRGSSKSRICTAWLLPTGITDNLTRVAKRLNLP